MNSGGKQDPAGAVSNPLLARFAKLETAEHVRRLNSKPQTAKKEPGLNEAPQKKSKKKSKLRQQSAKVSKKPSSTSSTRGEVLAHPRTRFSEDEKHQILQVLKAIERVTGCRPGFAHVDKAMWALLFQALIPEDERDDPTQQHKRYAPNLTYPQKGNKLAEAHFLDELGGFIHQVQRNTSISNPSWNITETNR